MYNRISLTVGNRHTAFVVILGAVAVIGACGCRSHVDNAVMSQRTLYAFHFQENGRELNNVGRYDLDVLLQRLRGYSGKIYLQRGDTPAELYEGRVRYVVSALESAGVEQERINVKEVTENVKRPPDEKYIVILSRDDEATMARR